ncbi:hypothetical protein KIM372_17570 [Bombiscardovia nodaiensis]|uniref:Integrase catalytic domain-containing protein n=1 Tax=Bombiscardovia nodaiensis TaxID=2932181 RepID=A0ABN6SCL8_9BIFI|nr:hypothetical protein KIM372_17570 [Bombiscardovia nodaiensis]
MRELIIRPRLKRRRRYSSYLGEITPVVPNLLERDFHAGTPGVKLLTDITEFRVRDGELYLSAIVDCYDGMIVTWTVGEHPDSALVERILDQLAQVLPGNATPVIHSDRGCRYRWPGWINSMKEQGEPDR